MSRYGYVNVSVWNMHLAYQSYGPYAACNALCDDAAQLMAGEYGLYTSSEGEQCLFLFIFMRMRNAGRVQNVREMLANAAFQSAVLHIERLLCHLQVRRAFAPI